MLPSFDRKMIDEFASFMAIDPLMINGVPSSQCRMSTALVHERFRRIRALICTMRGSILT